MAERKVDGKKVAASAGPAIAVEVNTIILVKGRTKDFHLSIDDRMVSIPVPEDIFTHAKNQFLDKRNTPDQKNRNATLRNLMRAAYKKGLEDGQTK
jgi:hypothetical protein